MRRMSALSFRSIPLGHLRMRLAGVRLPEGLLHLLISERKGTNTFLYWHVQAISSLFTLLQCGRAVTSKERLSPP